MARRKNEGEFMRVKVCATCHHDVIQDLGEELLRCSECGELACGKCVGGRVCCEIESPLERSEGPRAEEPDSDDATGPARTFLFPLCDKCGEEAYPGGARYIGMLTVCVPCWQKDSYSKEVSQ